MIWRYLLIVWFVSELSGNISETGGGASELVFLVHLMGNSELGSLTSMV